MKLLTNTVLCQISACELSALNGSRTHTNLHLCKPYPQLSYSHRFKLHSPPHVGRADDTCCCCCCCCPCHTLPPTLHYFPSKHEASQPPFFNVSVESQDLVLHQESPPLLSHEALRRWPRRLRNGLSHPAGPSFMKSWCYSCHKGNLQDQVSAFSG